jgi:hypothetical protein
MTLQADARAAAAELDYFVAALQPPTQLGEYALTGLLARSTTAAIYSARGPIFGAGIDGVLKLTGTAYAPILRRELDVLNAAARAEVEGVIRPLTADLVWLSATKHADRPVAALALPFLAGGDLTTLVARASRVGALGPGLALQVARRVAEALRGLLVDLDQPVRHGDLRPQHLLLPAPDASPAQLTLIDPASGDDSSAPADVRAFGELLGYVATGAGTATPTPATGAGRTILVTGAASAGRVTDNRAFDTLVRRCAAEPSAYVSMADPRLWSDLAAAEREQARRAASHRHPLEQLRAAVTAGTSRLRRP